VEIKRKIEACVRTKRRYFIRQPQSSEQIVCAECVGLMLTAEQIAVLLGISRRRVYQLVESGAAHFIETEAGTLFVCPNSLAKTLEEKL
jgi:excisionase family DNA binding protein